MSGVVSVAESNCQARALVGPYRAWTRCVLWTAWLMVPLGLCSFGAPFATLFLFGPETDESLWGFHGGGLAVKVALSLGLVWFCQHLWSRAPRSKGTSSRRPRGRYW